MTSWFRHHRAWQVCFTLAAAIQRWGLDRRIAFGTLALVGTRGDRVIAGNAGMRQTARCTAPVVDAVIGRT